jgi:hypothetical protein
MSTKGLMAHKRVKEVTLNDAGKADTLTLADGWTFEGSAGPFKLINVEHGHKIVKSAIGAGCTTSGPRKVKAASPAHPATPSEPLLNDRGELLHGQKKSQDFTKPTEPRGDVVFVYRITLVPTGDRKDEAAGWLKTSEERDDKALAEWAWINLANVALNGQLPRDKKSHLVKAFRWTNKHQEAARKDGVLGSPWGGENHG